MRNLHLKMKFVDRLIPVMFWWDSAICGMFNEAWVMHGHDVPECNAATIITAVEAVVQVNWKNLSLGQSTTQLVRTAMQSALTVNREIHI